MVQCYSSLKGYSANLDRFLYAIVTIDDPKYVKFGIAKNPQKRLATIQTGCPLELRIEAILPHSAGLENKVHGELRWYCLRGEWYTGCDEILRAVEIMKGGDAKLFSDYIETLSHNEYQAQA